jgi:hypothetical protein
MGLLQMCALSKLRSLPGYGIPEDLRFTCALFGNGGVL